MNTDHNPTPRVAIVVLNFNGLEDTIRCLASLRPLADQGHDVILVDNGSTVDPGPAAADALPGVVYLRNAANLGYAGGNNAGIRLALERGAEFLLILNNDTIVAPSLVDELVAALAEDPSIGVAGPWINFMDEPAVAMSGGMRFNHGPGTEFFTWVVIPPQPGRSSVTPVDIANGCCMIIKAEVLRQVGFFDEQFFIVHEESDLCLRAKRAGWGVVVLGRTLVWHKGSSAFERSGRRLQRYFDSRNLLYLIRRHSGRIAHSRSVGVSLVHYFRYCFYRYDIELDAGKSGAADAVVEGVYDGLRGVLGSYRPGRRFGIGMLAALFASRRRLAALIGRRPESST